MPLPTPPPTPKTYPTLTSAMLETYAGRTHPFPMPPRSLPHARPRSYSHFPSHAPTRAAPGPSPQASPPASPDDFALPPPLEPVPKLEMPEPAARAVSFAFAPRAAPAPAAQAQAHAWRPGMGPADRDAREAWLAAGRGRKGLRIVIVTENFLPKVDGVTRTLARLLEHLEREGHSCMLLGPGTGMSHYASHPLVGTAGVPLVLYPGLKLNFLRPKFMRTIQDFEPDVVHFVDPIWLGAQTLMAMELGWAGGDWVGQGGPAIGTGISGAVVASYHTNLATYATLFGLSWLEPIMWRFQRWLYSKTLLTLCPSPSTKGMLESQEFNNVRLWPRGVDLSQFGRSQRCTAMRARWGVGESPGACGEAATSSAGGKFSDPTFATGVHFSGRKSSLPLTPPASPLVIPSAAAPPGAVFSEPAPLAFPPSPPAAHFPRVVLLYVGRISWEKNLLLLLEAYGRLGAYLPANTLAPKLVFVGDGPARSELESICAERAFDATFMGHRSGSELAACYASADVFTFPSFTETFGQVVLEALASGLPVVGLDAEGTRDLVSHGSTGLLLPLPAEAAAGAGSAPPQNPSRTWPTICRNRAHPLFGHCVEGYAALLARASAVHSERAAMGARACTDGIRGFTWWDAMEKCVDGYRESMRISRAAREVRVTTAPPPTPSANIPCVPASPVPPRISRVNRALSRRLSPKPQVHRPPPHPHPHPRRPRAAGVYPKYSANHPLPDQGLSHLKTLAKLALATLVLWWIWSGHLASQGRALGWEEIFFVPATAAAAV